ncbi:MAG: organic radical-activating protein, partial [Nitrosopumilus sp.]|nr:organic radical-activating protein [Nitrosopumilus sp.]
RFNHVLPFIDIVKIEFKTKDSDFVDSQHYDKLIGHTMKCLISSVKEKKTTYIKIVVSSKTQIDEFKELINQIFQKISKENVDGFIIQPTYGVSEPSLELLLDLYDIVYPHYIDVKVVPQLHKFIGAP